MASRDLSSTVSEFDTEDISTSLATDLSISFLEDEKETDAKRKLGKRSKQSRVTKQLIERKQLFHDFQVLKIELSQRSLIIDNLKAEHLNKVDELEERLSDAIHQKQLLQAKLEGQLNMHQDDAKRRQQHLQTELETIIKRQQKLEARNIQLQRRAVDTRSAIKDVELTEGQYAELKSKNEEELTLHDIVAIKFYESVAPLQIEVADLRGWNRTLEAETAKCKSDLRKSHERLETESSNRSELEIKCQRLTLHLADIKSSIQHGDYKKDNYDQVKSERDNLSQDLMELKKRYSYLDVTYQQVASDRDDIAKELSTVKQELALVRQDKDYLHRQMNDVGVKYTNAEERLQQLNSDLENVKRAREELYEKYVESRDRFKAEYESKLREELEAIRLRTDGEVDKLKVGTREMYERENRNLRESRDNALSEKEKAAASERDCTTKYEQLMTEFRQLQMGGDAKAAELIAEVRLKNFEVERSQMLHEEASKNFRQSQLECDKYQQKIEVLTKEYYGLQTTSEKKGVDLEAQISELRSKLTVYEKLETELDDVVMQAADNETDMDAERVLFSYGYGANVPSTAKRRLQHSVHLARRVLKLERINTSLTKELELNKTQLSQLGDEVRTKELELNKTQLSQLGDELSNATSLLDQAQQPYNYLIDSIRSRDTHIDKHKNHITVLEEDIRRLKKQSEELTRARNQMSADLERLLNQREQMAMMKQVVVGLSQHQEYSSTNSMNPVHIERLDSPPMSKSQLESKSWSKSQRDNKMSHPQPTIFTRQDPPRWFNKLKEKNVH